jgi:TonB family protein
VSRDKKPKFLNKPFYPGGKEAFEAFVEEHLSYPKQAIAARAEATVRVQLTLDHKGKVLDAKALDRPGLGIEEEAERLAKLLRFSVQKNRGMRVTFSKTVKIPFKLPKHVPVPKVQQIAYSYRAAQPKPPKDKKKPKKPAKGISYSYQIKL